MKNLLQMGGTEDTRVQLEKRLLEVNRVMGNDFYRHFCGVLCRHIYSIVARHAEDLEDIKEAHRVIIEEPCRTDEKHCTCVPALRMEIARLKKEYAECYAIKEKAYLAAMGADAAQKGATMQIKRAIGIMTEITEIMEKERNGVYANKMELATKINAALARPTPLPAKTKE